MEKVFFLLAFVLTVNQTMGMNLRRKWQSSDDENSIFGTQRHPRRHPHRHGGQSSWITDVESLIPNESESESEELDLGLMEPDDDSQNSENNQNQGQSGQNTEQNDQNPGENGQNSQTPPPNNRLSCAERCPLIEEYDPVCGTNGVTYNNTAALICDAKCTPAIITVMRKGSCADRSTDPTPALPTVVTPINLLREPDDLVVRQCVNSCPPPTEYNPVCGTDDKVYFHSDRVECVRKCGVDVEVKHQGHC